jgi:hypothetical protein
MTKFVFKVWLAVASGILVGSILAGEEHSVIAFGAVMTGFAIGNLIIITLFERFIKRRS